MKYKIIENHIGNPKEIFWGILEEEELVYTFCGNGDRKSKTFVLSQIHDRDKKGIDIYAIAELLNLKVLHDPFFNSEVIVVDNINKKIEEYEKQERAALKYIRNEGKEERYIMCVVYLTTNFDWMKVWLIALLKEINDAQPS